MKKDRVFLQDAFWKQKPRNVSNRFFSIEINRLKAKFILLKNKEFEGMNSLVI